MALLTANRMNELGLKNQRLKIDILAERLKNALYSIQNAEKLINSQNEMDITELSFVEHKDNSVLTSSLVEIREQKSAEDKDSTENSGGTAQTALIGNYKGLLF